MPAAIYYLLYMLSVIYFYLVIFVVLIILEVLGVQNKNKCTFALELERDKIGAAYLALSSTIIIAVKK